MEASPQPSERARHKGAWLLGLAALLLLGLGFAVGIRAHLAARQTEHESASARRARDIAQLQGENESLRRKQQERSAGLAAQAAATVNPSRPSRELRLAALRQLADLMLPGSSPAITLLTLGDHAAAMGREFPLPAYLIDGTGKLPSGFGPLFGLGDDETNPLQQALASVKERVEASILQLATVREAGPGVWVLEQPAVPADQAAALQEELRAAFTATLGPDGYEIFAQLNGEKTGARDGVKRGGPADFFHGYGRFGRTITVSRDEKKYLLSIQYQGGPGNRPMTGMTSASIARAEDVPTSFDAYREVFGPLLKLLPPGL